MPGLVYGNKKEIVELTTIILVVNKEKHNSTNETKEYDKIKRNNNVKHVDI
jgi:hypothetical protein